MGANLALARLKKEAAVVVQLDCSGFIWHTYDGLVFNGLLFIWGTFKKMNMSSTNTRYALLWYERHER
jgi:hypothetical protein